MTRAPRSSRHSAALRQTSYAYRFAAGYAILRSHLHEVHSGDTLYSAITITALIPNGTTGTVVAATSTRRACPRGRTQISIATIASADAMKLAIRVEAESNAVVTFGSLCLRYAPRTVADR